MWWRSPTHVDMADLPIPDELPPSELELPLSELELPPDEVSKREPIDGGLHSVDDRVRAGRCPSCGGGAGTLFAACAVVECEACQVPWPVDYWVEQADSDAETEADSGVDS